MRDVRWRPIRRSSDELIRWDEPKELVGWYRGWEPRPGRTGEAPKRLHFFDLLDGRFVAAFGTAQLNEALERVRDGDLVKICYKRQDPRNRVKHFEVYVCEEGDQAEGHEQTD